MDKKKKSIKLEWLGGIKEDVPSTVKKIEISTSKNQSKKISELKSLETEETDIDMKRLKVKFRKEVKGRSGHPVFVLFKFEPQAPSASQLQKLCGLLKSALGCGGTVENSTIVIQTTDEQRLQSALEKTLAKFN